MKTKLDKVRVILEIAGKWGKLKFYPCNVILIYGREFVSLIGLYGT
jgi:hypothetical protein